MQKRLASFGKSCGKGGGLLGGQLVACNDAITSYSRIMSCVQHPNLIMLHGFVSKVLSKGEAVSVCVRWLLAGELRLPK